MKTRILCLILVAMASPSLARQQTETSRASDPKAEEKPSISGRVRSADTDQPLNKAKLTLQSVIGGRNYTAETQSDGTFQLDNFEPGIYWLSAEKTGFVRQEYGARRPGESRTGTVLDLRTRPDRSPIVIKLIREGVIGGKVVDQDGDPIPRANVQLMRYRYFRGRRTLLPLVGSWGAMTNELGEYKIGGVPPGEYEVSAVVRQFTPPSSTSSSPQESFLPAYYPSATRPEEAVPVSITSGAELNGINVQLSRARTFRVKGSISGLVEGENLLVALTTNGEIQVGLFNTQYLPVRPGGVFEFAGVFPGDYVLTAQGAQDGRAKSQRRQVRVTDSNIDGVILEVSGSATVTGKLTLEAERPEPPDAQPAKVPSGIRVHLVSADNPFIPEVSASVAEDGAFSFKNLGLDRYEVRVSGLPPNYYAKSVSTVRAEIPDRILDLASGLTSANLLLSAAPSAGTVGGKAKNAKGDPMTGATVVLVPLGETPVASLFQVTKSATGGAFTFHGVPPGDYYVLAWEDVEPGAYLDPEFRKRFGSEKAEVTAKKAARVNVDVTVAREK